MLTIKYAFVFLLFPLPFFIKLRPKKTIHLPFFSHKQENLTRYNRHFLMIWMILLCALSNPILYFHSDKIHFIPTWFLIDTSPSMSKKNQSESSLEKIKGELMIFLSPESKKKIGLILFSKKNEIFSPITFDNQTQSQWIPFINSEQLGKETHILPAFEKALYHTDKNAQIVLFSDGQEDFDLEYQEKLIHQAQQKKAAFHFVNYGEEAAKSHLLQIVTATSGEIHTPENWQKTLIFQNITNQYHEYDPSNHLFLGVLGLCLALLLRIHQDEKRTFPI